jgi:hypothetical protein
MRLLDAGESTSSPARMLARLFQRQLEFPKPWNSQRLDRGFHTRLERFRAKWTPVRVKKTRQNKKD